MSRLATWALQATLAFTALSFNMDIQACTGIRIKANDGSIIYGRTLEFSTDLQSKIIYIPKGVDYKGATATGQDNGMQWKVNYPMVGIASFGLPFIVDGVNSQGLAVGIYYFPGYAGYIESTDENRKKSLGAWQLPTYLLSQFATVDDVKKALNDVDVVNAKFSAPNMPPLELHFVVHDASGKSIVIEYIKGKLNTYDNPIGIITNSPSFDWHLTNLGNHVNLDVNNVPPIKVEGVQITGFGQGSGMLGLPGDFTPPSRFVRAAVFSQSYIPAKTGADGVFHLFHILNQFDIPKGAIRDTAAPADANMDYTQWTSTANLTDKKYYYHTYRHRDVGMIDLNKMDPNAKEVQFFPMDKTVNEPEGTY